MKDADDDFSLLGNIIDLWRRDRAIIDQLIEENAAMRNSKGVQAQRSRARHLAYKRRPIKLKYPLTSGEIDAMKARVAHGLPFDDPLIDALSRMSPVAFMDYLEWLKTATVEETHVGKTDQ